MNKKFVTFEWTKILFHLNKWKIVIFERIKNNFLNEWKNNLFYVNKKYSISFEWMKIVSFEWIENNLFLSKE